MKARIALVVVAIALVACAASPPPVTRVPEPPRPDRPPTPPSLPLATLADPSAIAFATLDVAATRSLPYGNSVRLALSRLLAPSEAQDVSDVVDRIDDAVLSVRSATSLSYVGVALLRGRFVPEDATRLAGTSSASVVPFLSDSFVARGETVDAALVADHTLIVGQRRLVDDALERERAGGGGGPPSDPRFASLAADLGFDTARTTLAVVPDPALLRALEREAFHLPEGSLDGVRGYGLVLELGVSVTVHAALRADTATRLVAQGLIEADLARASDDARVRALGLAEAAARAVPRIDGDVLRLDLELDAGEASRWLGAGSSAGPVAP